MLISRQVGRGVCCAVWPRHHPGTAASQWQRSAASMRAAVYHEFGGKLAVEEVPRPVAPVGGVVVDVHANGLCRSDWHGWQGHDPDISVLPHVPGHELAGVVTEVGAGVEKFKVGDAVVAPFILACGSCPECVVSKRPTVCRQQKQPGFHIWGSFAEAVALPRADINLLPLAATVSFEMAASLGCRLTTAYRAIVAQGRVKEGTKVIIFGCGGVGMSAVIICRALGAQVVAADVDSTARRRAVELGADVAVDATMDDSELRQALIDATGGGAEVALDCVGGAGTVSTVNAAWSLKPGGRLVQVALPHDGPALPLALFAARELELIGSHGASQTDLQSVLRMVSEGRLSPADLIMERISLTASCRHLMDMSSPDSAAGGMRVCVDFKA